MSSEKDIKDQQHIKRIPAEILEKFNLKKKKKENLK